jgi:hypothetical protein
VGDDGWRMAFGYAEFLRVKGIEVHGGRIAPGQLPSSPAFRRQMCHPSLLANNTHCVRATGQGVVAVDFDF